MKRTMIHCSSQQAFEEVITLLSTHNYTFTQKVFTDSSFPMLSHEGNYGDIILEGVPEIDHIEEIKKIARITIQENENQGSRGKINILHYGLIAYALLASFLAYHFWNKNRIMSRDKNYIYNWDSNGEEMTQTTLFGNRTVSKYFDKNFDANFEMSLGYDRAGNIIFVNYDENEDGNCERGLQKNSKDETMMLYSDDDEDGVSEHIQYILANGDTLNLKLDDEKYSYTINGN